MNPRTPLANLLPQSLSLPLSVADRVLLKGHAHHLSPVVIIGDAGLTPSVLKEIATALKAHALIKVRVVGDDREARLSALNTITSELACAPVQTIGKLLVLYKPKPVAKPKEYLPKKYAAMGLTEKPAPKRTPRKAEVDETPKRGRFQPVYFEDPTRPGRAPRLNSRTPAPYPSRPRREEGSDYNNAEGAQRPTDPGAAPRRAVSKTNPLTTGTRPSNRTRK